MKKRFNNEYADADGMDLMHGGDGDATYGPVTDPRKGPLPGLGGAGYTPPSSSSPKKSAQDKVKGGLDLAKQGIELANSVKGLFGNKPRKTSAPTPTGSKGGGAPKKGMSTGTKVAIGAGVALLIGIVIYAATRSSSKK